MEILQFTSLTMAQAVDSVSQSDFFIMLVQLAAYITPFFLIPATFKYGLGVFGNLAGMVNDRARGVFDRQKKYRANKYAYNSARMKAGERFNNRGLNALTSRASTKRFGFTGQGREAYQQKINNAGIDFSKSAQAQAIQHNDGALRALTYGSAAEARAMLGRSAAEGGFGMSAAEIESSVAAAQAAGGFGRNRQVYAAQQLAATGTGYDNIEQASKAIARAANGNAGQAAALSGNINSVTKGVGRYDLAPGFGKLNGLAQAELASGASPDAYHAATVAATRGADPVTILRGKPTEVKNLTSALGKHLDTQTKRMNDSSLSAAERGEAAMEVKQTIGQINQLDQSKSYASSENQMLVNELVVGTQGDVQTVTDQLRSTPYGEEHMDDIKRFSATPQYPNDPRLQQPDKKE